MTPTAERPLDWHTRPASETIEELRSDPIQGLSAEEAAHRLRRVGRNEIVVERDEPWWSEIIEAFTEPLVPLLLAVAVLYAILGEIGDAITIFVVILGVATFEMLTEARAQRGIAALQTLSAPVAVVIRDGQPRELPAAEVVTGDIVLLNPGKRVPADLRLLDSEALRIDESSLTGESMPVHKQATVVLSSATELGDRINQAFAGTLVTAGKGRGIVVATGRATQVGQIATLTEQVREAHTPLQGHMRELSHWLVLLAIGFSVLVPLFGVLIADEPFRDMLLTGLTLAFATIPEELPILITIVLGLGAYRLAREDAIAKRLQAVETLGSVSVIGTDKTGTLTQNQMRVTTVMVDGTAQLVSDTGHMPSVARVLTVGALANDAQLAESNGQRQYVGDPTETALLAAADERGLDVAALRANVQILDEAPFDDARKRMAVLYEQDGTRWLAMKGAPESVLSVSTHIRLSDHDAPLTSEQAASVRAAVDQLATDGLRVLACAERRLSARASEVDERELTFLGLVGLADPPRAEVPAAIQALRGAGVRVVMITGDHPATAQAIARQVGIEPEPVVLGRAVEAASDAQLGALVRTTSVFARIAPEHKLRIVRSLQTDGEIVAVTGDGVNDAPALREAAIGVAMGKSGTDVAREAADLVLADDNFQTIAVAVRGGRVLFANLYKAVCYYLAAKVALVSASLVPVLLGWPVPLVPIQIIVTELFMDLGASTTFVAEPPEEDVMARPPRDPRRPFMDRGMRLGILGGGLSLAAAVVVAYGWARSQDLSVEQTQTAAFVTWMIGHLVLAAHLRSERQPLLRTSPLANRPFLGWIASVAALVGLGLTVPVLRDRLHLAIIPASTWVVMVAAALLLPSWWEIVKWIRRWRRASAAGLRT